MNKVKYIVLFAVLAFVPLAWVQGATNDLPAAKESPLSLSIDLVDGSRLIGVPDISSIPVQTYYAKLDVALKNIKTVKMEKDRELAVFEMGNGDRIKGALILKTLDLQTAFGKVTVGIEHVVALQVLGDKQGHLILWNKLGNAEEVANSEIGVNGIIEGSVVYGPVKNGNGVALQTGSSLVKFDKPFGDNFPEAGCIEFWWTPARDENSSTTSHMDERTVFVLSSAQRRPDASSRTALDIMVKYRTWDPDCRNRTMACFEMYDEATGTVSGITSAYDLNFMAGQPMHLALTWNREWGRQGIKLFKDGVEMPFAYSSGGEISPAIDTIRRCLPGLTYDLALLRSPRRRDGAAPRFDAGSYVEHLKIWNYAKTNFADSLVGPGL